MRIAMVVNMFPLLSESFISRQIAELTDLGHEVDIFARGPVDRDEPIHQHVTSRGLAQRVTVLREGLEEVRGRKLIQRLRAARLISSVGARAPSAALAALRAQRPPLRHPSLATLHHVDRFARNPSQYDIIHCQFGTLGRRFAYLRDLLGVPLVVSFRGSDGHSFPSEFGPNVYDTLFEKADLFTAVSEDLRLRMIRLGCPADRIVVHYSGTDVREFSPRPRQPPLNGALRLVVVSRLVAEKGLWVILDAIDLLRRSLSEVHLEIIGDGPLRSQLLGEIERRALAEHVTLLGALPSSFVVNALQRAHVLVHASFAEGLPGVVVEAQAMGFPVVATDVGGAREVVAHGNTGFLVAPADAGEIAQRLLELGTDPALWQNLSAAARPNVEERFDARRLAAQMIERYQLLQLRLPNPNDLDAPS